MALHDLIPRFNSNFASDALDAQTLKLRNELKWDPNQLDEIYKLYARYVEQGRAFPADIEEHSLRLILEFVRPDDMEVARRLIAVLQALGKTVPDKVLELAEIDPSTADDSLLKLQIEMLRTNLRWDPMQLGTIYNLYAQCVERGIPFPLEIEEHSLWLVHKFLRPDDDGVAGQLISVLKRLGKPVPDYLKKLAGKRLVSSLEQLAADEREKQIERASNSRLGTVPIHQRLVFVVGLPKSASRLMVAMLAAMHPHERYRMAGVLPYSTGFIGVDVTSELRYDALSDYSGGGVVHTHLSATNVSRHALARLGLAHVITVRHPADHIAALYCHIRGIASRGFETTELQRRIEAEPLPDPLASASLYVREEEPSQLYFHDVIFPVNIRFFAPSVDVDDAIAHMITGGYLYHALSWIVSWQILRVRNISAIVRYEDLIGDTDSTLRRLNSIIYQSNSEEAIARGRNVMDEQTYESSASPAIYPRGSTGSKDIWKRYLSKANRELYNTTCERFLAGHPYGALVKDLYDDLLLLRDD